MEIDILFENEDFILINKPRGLIVERNAYEQPSVEELVEQHLRKQKKKPFVGIVHRLDRVTTGIMLFSKKKSILKLLNLQFEQKRIRKTYLAVVENQPDKEKGRLQHYLYKDLNQKKAILFTNQKKDSKKVVLDFKLLYQADNLSLLKIQPHTGKFHQIRAQLASIGCPIVGDGKYGSTKSYFPKAIALHASSLSFFDPKTNERLNFDAPPPTVSVWQGLSNQT